jgi:lipopolysaccharide/colanic/teichoic acid biosynthesis glycosyltransferase
MKRAFDFIAALVGLTLLSPLLLALAAAIKATSRGPVLFRQRRMGRGFREFSIYKFRTMVHNAEQIGGQLTAGRDPRVTRIGAVLRKTKLDELPQLFNVLRGDMSFVGPRPEVPKYVEMFRSDYADLLTVRPGITDFASLKYRHESDLLGAAEDPERVYIHEVLPDKIALGKDYVQRRSMLLDLWLMMKTVMRIAR